MTSKSQRLSGDPIVKYWPSATAPDTLCWLMSSREKPSTLSTPAQNPSRVYRGKTTI